MDSRLTRLQSEQVRIDSVDMQQTLEPNLDEQAGFWNFQLPAGMGLGSVQATKTGIFGFTWPQQLEARIHQGTAQSPRIDVDITGGGDRNQWATADVGDSFNFGVSVPDAVSTRIFGQYEDGQWDGIQPGEAEWSLEITRRTQTYASANAPVTIMGTNVPSGIEGITPPLDQFSIASCSLSPRQVTVGDAVTLEAVVANDSFYNAEVTVEWTSGAQPIQASATIPARGQNTLQRTATPAEMGIEVDPGASIQVNVDASVVDASV